MLETAELHAAPASALMKPTAVQPHSTLNAQQLWSWVQEFDPASEGLDPPLDEPLDELLDAPPSGCEKHAELQLDCAHS